MLQPGIEREERGDASISGMVWIPGGTFRMGSDHHYPEEKPSHRASVAGFWIDRTPVTNRQFKAFVNATGHVTTARIVPNPADYPGALPDMLYAGSLIFTPPPRVTDLRDWSQWWTFMKGASWRRPDRPKSNLRGVDEHPRGACLVRRRARLCRLGRQGAADRGRVGVRCARRPRRRGVCMGQPACARWQTYGQHLQGDFPLQNLSEDGFERTSPVTAFRPNPCGVHDMIGNVWEWTTDWWSMRHEADAPKACCIPSNPRGGPESASYDPMLPNIRIPRKVLKGGSHLCAPNYCCRYRPAARHAEPVDTSTSHVGLRCVVRSSRERPSSKGVFDE